MLATQVAQAPALTFSFNPASYMFLTDTNDAGEWAPGKLVPFQDLTVSPASAIFNYGQAIFEGLKAQRTPSGRIVLFRPQENAQRFASSAERLVMPVFPPGRFIDAVHQVVRANADWVPAHGVGSLYLRPVMIGCGPVLGVQPAQSYTMYIFACPVGPYLPGPGRVIVFDDAHRAAPHGTGHVKTSSNYAPTLYAQKRAKNLGYKDALYLDARHDRYVEELGSSNFFAIYRDGTLVTPSLGSILPGITRDSVLAIARQHLHWPVQETAMDIEVLLANAVEAFFTGTAAVMQPVNLINYRGKDYEIGTGEGFGPASQTLHDWLIGIQGGSRADDFGWITPVNLED